MPQAGSFLGTMLPQRRWGGGNGLQGAEGMEDKAGKAKAGQLEGTGE